jgi:uncharacterized membrane protein
MISNSWSKIIGLSTLQGAISLTWLVYNIYLPKLLISYGFSPGLAVILLIVENAIAVILEPLFGSLSDRAYRWIATKFGFVSLGVILTATLTILIPTIFVFRDLFTAVNWILPVVLVAWAMAMTIFRTPAISLIGRYASASDLPIAMSFLTVAGGFIGALKPISQNFILSLGAPFAFFIASIVLLGSTGLLRYLDPASDENIPVTKGQPIVIANIGLLVAMGLGIGGVSRCLFETLPKIIKLQLPQSDPPTLMSFIFLAIAISALPGGILAAKIGNRKLMAIGIISTLVGLLIMVFVPTSMALIAAISLFVCCFSWVTNGAIPLAINLLPANRSGLAVGMYFSGVGASVSLFGMLFNPVTNLTPFLGAICGSVGLIIAGGCVWKSINN